MLGKKNKKKSNLSKLEETLKNTDSQITTNSLDHVSEINARLDWFRNQLDLCSDVVFHTFTVKSNQKCALIYIQGMTDLKTIQEDVLNKVVSSNDWGSSQEFIEKIFDFKQLAVSNLKVLSSLQNGLTAILCGHALLLIDGDSRLIEFPFSSLEKRAIEDAPNESVIRGPREAFIEELDVNLTLLRRRLRTKNFKTESMEIGKETKTKVILAYVQGVCQADLVMKVKKRLSLIEIDGVLGAGYLEEYIEDNPFSPFPQIQYTERPDVVVSSLLEGRIAIMVNGTPIALIAPATFFSLLQSPDDYYQRFIAATLIRWMRFVFLFVSFLLPAIYIAITTFHPELIPWNLLITISAQREVVPFPAIIEAFLMEISFEVLREASVRIPKSVGQSVTIIGALIIGTAAVQAGLVSAAKVIIVSLTGIASFMTPHYALGLSFRLLRFPIMLIAGFLGFYGIICAVLIIYIHLLNLRSFGTPYLSPVAPLNASALKDIAVRVPWWAIKKKPYRYGTNRQESKTRKWKQSQMEEID